MTRTLLLGLLLSMAASPAALAQPDPNAAPAAGLIELEDGPMTEPYAVEVTAGGPVAAETADPACTGFVSAAPSAVVAYGGGEDGYQLHLYVRSDDDTVLLVHTPGGTWHCNDDEEGLDPGLWVEEAGRYAVWVGTFSGEAGAASAATLYAFEQDRTDFLLDPEAAPLAGVVTLEAGFAQDPHEVAVMAGGQAPVEMGDMFCAGYASAAPSVVLDYGGADSLYVYARPTAEMDLTLLVRGPDGTVYCNDDADGFDPGLVVAPAAAGRYAVWVGTFAAMTGGDGPTPAALFFSEVEGPIGGSDFEEDYYDEDGTYGGGENISRFAPPAHGTLSLDAGFGSREAAVEAGGPDAVSVSGFGCVGYIANGEPDLNVLYGGEGDLLAFYTEADDDLTMVVNFPDGSWRCSDDALDRNPAIVVEAPEGGLYNVWVGTYSQGGGAEATLHVAEQDPR